MNNITNALVIAEEIVEKWGDPNWFKNDYVLLRENNGIVESIRQALVSQNLWDTFVSRCDPSWLAAYYQ